MLSPLNYDEWPLYTQACHVITRLEQGCSSKKETKETLPVLHLSVLAPPFIYTCLAARSTGTLVKQ